MGITTTPAVVQTVASAPEISASLEAGLQHQANGQYAAAIAAYQALLDGVPMPADARRARFLIAESYSFDHAYSKAAAAWEAFIAQYPGDASLAQARLMAARAHHNTGQCDQAVLRYAEYLEAETLLADLVYEWIGDCHTKSEDMNKAIEAYREALDRSRDKGAQASLRERIADAHLSQARYGEAVAEYDTILGEAKNQSYRAELEFLAGQALEADGQAAMAQERYRRAVDGYPKTEYAYLSLLELLEDGLQVDELLRGMVSFHAGDDYSDAYGAAIQSFDRYLGGDTAEKADEARFCKALAQRELGLTRDAQQTLEQLISSHPGSTFLPSVWLEKGATLAQIGDIEGAIDSYRTVAALFPHHELAPKALWKAAKLREGAGAYDAAAVLYREVQESFPRSEDASESLWRAGIAQYRAGNPTEAVATWLLMLDRYAETSPRARAMYWIGKLAPAVEGVDAQETWNQLVDTLPNNYYALRVRQIRSGESLTISRLITTTSVPLVWNPAGAETEILSWLGKWTDAPASTDLGELPESLAKRRSLRRGQALMDVGLRQQALEEFDRARSAVWDKPVALAQLALFFHKRSLNGLAARSALRLAYLSPQGSIGAAPEALQHLAYPLDYAGLLSAEAQARQLDPLLLAAIIRQESLFEPAAESYAGARGLGQVMPATGRGIAKSLKMEDFNLEDLYRPSVSIRFSAFYTAVQLKRFDNQLLLALAAYNGGPGNTLRWLEDAGDDLDLFVEVITAAQSQVYLKRVYAQYLLYESLYRSGGDGP